MKRQVRVEEHGRRHFRHTPIYCMCRGRGKEGKSVYFYFGFKTREDGRQDNSALVFTFKLKKKISVISL